ncbi:MAG TPA: hypothetical protein VM553_08965, partial [Dongiaceae bacterium]|nr:hypothetical protein [Dongiaceae bacterium]
MKLQADAAFKAGVVILVTLVSAYLIGLSYSYWWDELLSVSQAQLGVSEMFTKTILIDVHPPLYPFLLKIWVALFGISEIATRSLSFIFALGALLVFQHNLTQLTHNALERGLSVLFFVCAWPFLFYGNEVRSYSLLLFLSTVCY